ncbi:MAG: 50S ribosomal protein L10 [Candidatus Paceibacterota bacterium]
MPLTKAKKEEIVSTITNGIQDAGSVVLVNFHGLTVADESLLRKNLREQGVTYKVARKTLIKRALAGKAEGELPTLPGEVAVVYGKDAITPAREIFNFEKEHKGVMQILGGVFDGKFVDGAYMTEIATIPSREVLLSKIAFLLKSPMQRLAIAVNEVAKTK